MNEEARQHPAETPENSNKKDEKNGGFELYQLLRDMVYLKRTLKREES